MKILFLVFPGRMIVLCEKIRFKRFKDTLTTYAGQRSISKINLLYFIFLQ